MSDPDTITVSILGSINDIDPETWDACAVINSDERPEDPFTTHRFLKAVEDSGSVGPNTGWQARHAVAYENEAVIGVMPMYAKGHSQGEYIFDHNWAHAYENAGGRYYPKLQTAVPFTPATGRRFLTLPDHTNTATSALIQAATQLASQNNVSSFHVTFCTEQEAAVGSKLGMMARKGQQFHWYNQGYETFDDFLATLTSRKRKNIRKERAKAQSFGGKIHHFTGAEITPELWDIFWEFYQDTGARKWGTPYLTRTFFDIAQETLRDDILLIMCERDGEFIAGALNFIGNDVLYGRYWGCVEDVPCLHFETCYYQAIDYAIAHGLSRVEAGAQGAHKLARGYLPAPIYSLHWIQDAGFSRAVGEYLEAETAAIDEEIDILTSYGPFKRGNDDEQKTDIY